MKKPLYLVAFFALLGHGSFAQLATQLSVQDSRDTSTTPAIYSSAMQANFRTHADLGLSATTGHSTVLGFRGNFGYYRRSYELAFSEDEMLRLRTAMASSASWGPWRKVLVEDNNGQVALNANHNYITLGQAAYPHGFATLGYGSGKNALLYHFQVNNGPTLKVDIEGNNWSPVIHASGTGYYLNGGLFNVDYTHANYVYTTAAYKTNISGSHSMPGATVIGFQSNSTTVSGTAFGGHFTTHSSGAGTAYGLYVDSYLSGSNTGSVWGVYVNRGTSFFNDKVGIGTTTPQAKLEVQGTIRATSATPPTSGAGLELLYDAPNGISNIYSYDRSSGSYKTMNFNDAVRLLPNGNLGIGTANPKAKLSVNGDIFSKKVKVTIAQSDWADYVFEPSYKLLSLQEVESFIKSHRHLPGVPSAADVEKEGLDVGNSQATLLKKIEELTLYVIDLQKQVNEQKSVIEALQEKHGQKHEK